MKRSGENQVTATWEVTTGVEHTGVWPWSPYMKAQPALQSLSLVNLTLDPLSFGLPVTMVFPTQLLLSLLLYLHIHFMAPMKLNLVVALNHIPPWWVMICLPCCYDGIYDKVTSEGLILPHSSRTQSVMEAEVCGCCFHSQEAGRQRYPYPAFFLYIQSGSEARGAVLLMFRGGSFHLNPF